MRVQAWVLTACLSALPAFAQNNPGPPNEANVEEGHRIFNSSCTACHGYDAEAGDRGPALAAPRRYSRNSEAQLLDAIRNGIPGTAMPALPLPEADARKVVAYIRSLRSTAMDTPVKGDVAHGERIFWTKGQCGDCHMVHGRGGLMGPDLSNVASQRKLAMIRDALTKPKPRPSPGFVPVRVVDKDGHAISGILKNEHNFSLQVLGSDNALHLLDRAEVRAVVYESKSLMPADYDRRLTPDELQDLLAFLSRQGTRAPELRQRRREDQ